MIDSKFDPFVAEWASYVNNPNLGPIEKYLKMAQLLEYPDLDIGAYVEKINILGKHCWSVCPDEGEIIDRVSRFNGEFFGSLGYGPNEADYYDPRNNFLNEVVDKKTGIPITISIMYAEVAKHTGLDVRVVDFPGHVLAKIGETIILDPYNGGMIVKHRDLQIILDNTFDGEVLFRPEYLDEARPENIMIRMARNLKNSYMYSYDYERAKRCADMVLAFDPESPEDVRDKGIIEGRLLHYKDSLTHLNRYLEINPSGYDVDHVLEMIKSIREKI
ncbi:MAG: Transglutaminase-like superfamily protein [Cenarchaeum symbiont of Oopsacas minuta]|nr:Transglutaminase-like superfamily protein [Cenarchaeum symbiont of Oopsacas minuta]